DPARSATSGRGQGPSRQEGARGGRPASLGPRRPDRRGARAEARQLGDREAVAVGPRVPQPRPSGARSSGGRQVRHRGGEDRARGGEHPLARAQVGRSVRRALPTVAPLPLLRRREPFDDRAWIFELKLDGFRALAYIECGEARLVSRNGNTFRKFAGLCDALARLRGRDAILDGEIVCLDDDGRPSFDALYYRRREPCFFAFDLPWLDGRDLRGLPLLER